jgi:four helix bundle protein
MRDHRALRAFDLADEIALMTYKITKQFPREEIYGLVSQMRRAAVSVPSNIVEGC